jgi:ElaB/YqjD/DUF883 family membrane-anchored ribosome-binding protein
MAQEPDLTRQGPEEIREKIDATRSDLSDKLEALEHKVRETVSDAKGAVSDTVESVKQTVDSTVCAVKESVHDAFDTVKDSLDVSRQVDRHPWAMLAGSIAAGFVTGRLLDKQTTGNVAMNLTMAYTPKGTGHHGDAAGTAWQADTRPGLLSELGDKFGSELGQLKGLAIGALMSLAREFVKDSVSPALAPELERVIDDVTSKLGGKPIHGEIWPPWRKISHRGP